MEAIARYNNIRISPRKTRKVVDLIRAMSVTQAIRVLRHLPHKAAPYIIDVLRSALANLNQQHKGKPLLSSAVMIKEVYVNMGPVLKRIQPAPQGRAHPIRKPSAHIFVKVYLDEGQQSRTPVPTMAYPLQQSEANPLSSNTHITTNPSTTLLTAQYKRDIIPQRPMEPNAQPKFTTASVKVTSQTTQEGTAPKDATNTPLGDAPETETSIAKLIPPKTTQHAQQAEAKEQTTAKKAHLDTKETTKK